MFATLIRPSETARGAARAGLAPTVEHGQVAVALTMRSLLLLLCLALASACAHVQPWQREDLARRSMTDDEDPGEGRFNQHARGSRGAGRRHRARGGWVRVQLTRVCAALLLLSGAAYADGSLSMRGMYYRERSTLVRQPMVNARLDVGENGSLDGHLLVNAITSASPAAGTPQRFSELRYEGGVGYTPRLGDTSVGANGRYTENDYTSLLLGGNAEFRLLDENTTLRVALGLGFDTITNGVAQEQGGLQGIPGRSESLSSSLSSLSLTQLLITPQLVANVTYDFMLLDGFQANMYRIVLGGMIPVAERIPDLRVRHAISGSLRGYLRGRTPRRSSPTATTATIGTSRRIRPRCV